MTASQQGYDKVVNVLLSGQANPNLSDKDERTALWWAAYEGYDDIVKLLIEKGADLDYADLDGATVLGVACEEGHTAVVEALLPSAQVDLASKFCGTYHPPLFIAVKLGHVGIIETLVKNGATENLGEDWAKRAISLAVTRRHDEVVQLLLRIEAISNNNI
ncbi:hypothetical protein CEP52_006865 [Fusarium oligoseptatum]|uniref:Uncharacterized protein n=1 Tax=Fusarium oligoseptatum TaxID=2604345 RepID=A0A428TQK7_9HYPO|nr:hypothetical protein CEP52_006865 [Fusarium oligoseptatum]